MSDDIKVKLKEIIVGYLDEDEIDISQDISPDAHIIEDLGLDSFYIIDLIIDIENEFDIAIENDTIVNLVTVQNVIDL
ncbi:MAG: acyl carrier protein, partial [Balneolaceae bacterium]